MKLSHERKQAYLHALALVLLVLALLLSWVTITKLGIFAAALGEQWFEFFYEVPEAFLYLLCSLGYGLVVLVSAVLLRLRHEWARIVSVVVQGLNALLLAVTGASWLFSLLPGNNAVTWQVRLVYEVITADVNSVRTLDPLLSLELSVLSVSLLLLIGAGFLAYGVYCLLTAPRGTTRSSPSNYDAGQPPVA